MIKCGFKKFWCLREACLFFEYKYPSLVGLPAQEAVRRAQEITISLSNHGKYIARCYFHNEAMQTKDPAYKEISEAEYLASLIFES